MTQFQENTPTDSKMEGGQTLFHRTLLATARKNRRFQQIKLQVDWHLKVKDIEYNVDKNKTYCLTVSMQEIISIHKVLFRYSRFLGVMN